MTAQEPPREYVLRDRGMWIAPRQDWGYTHTVAKALLYPTAESAQRGMTQHVHRGAHCEIWSLGAALDKDAQP